jgi:nucleoside-diphosphate-sugar epimerase
MKKILVCGAGGFIGHHLVNRLKDEGFWVRGVDIKYPVYEETRADEFIQGDLREKSLCNNVLSSGINEVYQLAADMGGAGFVFSGENDANIMHNSALINLNVVEASVQKKVSKVFYSSSACMYPERNQMDPDNPNCAEDSAYPAEPDSEYGWEKLFSERFYLAAKRNYDIDVRIARFHNIFGTLGSWNDGREKAPAALCRKVAENPNGGVIDVWGDGLQTRSFLYIDECLDGVRRLMDSNVDEPLNIGSDEMITINDLAKLVMSYAGKKQSINNIQGPLGVRGRNSDNSLINKKLGWAPSEPLEKGIQKTYDWISKQVENAQ